MIQVAIAEDNDFLAKSIQEKLGFFKDLKYNFRGVDGLDLLEQLKSDHNIDVILMDIEMPEMDGITATAEVKRLYPHIKIIMLTVFDDEERIFNSIKAGADGYLLKDETPDIIHDGVLEILAGGAPMSASIAMKALRLLRNPIAEQKAETINYELTEREVEVLEQLSKGLNYSEIADNLNISSGTIRKHVENTYRKLQVHNKMEAVNLAKQARII